MRAFSNSLKIAVTSLLISSNALALNEQAAPAPPLYTLNNFFAYLASTGKCRTDNKQPCEITLTSSVDFNYALKFCKQLGKWSVKYHPERIRLDATLRAKAGECEVTSVNVVDGTTKSCILSTEQINKLTSTESMNIAIHYDQHIKDQDAYNANLVNYINAAKPLLDCLNYTAPSQELKPNIIPAPK